MVGDDRAESGVSIVEGMSIRGELGFCLDNGAEVESNVCVCV